MIGKNTNVPLILKKSNTYRVVGLSTAPGKILEQIILECISEHVKGNKVIENSQHGITNDKSCLTNLITLMIGSVNKSSAVKVA